MHFRIFCRQLHWMLKSCERIIRTKELRRKMCRFQDRRISIAQQMLNQGTYGRPRKNDQLWHLRWRRCRSRKIDEYRKLQYRKLRMIGDNLINWENSCKVWRPRKVLRNRDSPTQIGRVETFVWYFIYIKKLTIQYSGIQFWKV